MKHRIATLLAGGFLALALIGAAAAGPLEDSDTAYQRGDYVTALRLARPLAEAGTAEAQFKLGKMYAHGLGVQRDYAQAVMLYRKAAEQGNAEAQNNLGVMYQRGRGMPQDYAQAVTWYRKAADLGDAIAESNLGAMYQSGQGVPQDYTQALVWYRKAAEQGYAGAQFNLGLMYAHGLGVQRDYAQAVMWYRKAAERGNAEAQAELPRLCNSVNTQQTACADFQATPAQPAAIPTHPAATSAAPTPPAVVAQKQPAAEPSPADECHGVDIFSTSKEPWWDAKVAAASGRYKQAICFWRWQAAQGNAIAQGNLGGMYDRGEGVPQDYVQAVAWYRKAADQGDRDAQIKLAIMYLQGHGVSKDTRQAALLCDKAANEGDLAAQMCMGSAGYESGDYVMSYMWADIVASSDRNDPDASREQDIKFRDMVADKMTPAQLADAQRRASLWRPVK